jgi:hypothetical protein
MRTRILVPIAILVVALGVAAAATAATGMFLPSDSGFDSPTDTTVATTASSSPDGTSGDVNDVSSGPDHATTETESSANLASGETQTFAAADAGSVTISRGADTLTVLDVTTNPDWSSAIRMGTGIEVEVVFLNGPTRVEFSAEIENGTVNVKVRIETSTNSGSSLTTTTTASSHDDGSTSTTTTSTSPTTTTTTGPTTTTSPTTTTTPVASDTPYLSLGGSIVVHSTGSAISLVSSIAVDGYTTEIHDNGPTRVEVRFNNGLTEWRIRVDLVNGALQVEITQH